MEEQRCWKALQVKSAREKDAMELQQTLIRTLTNVSIKIPHFACELPISFSLAGFTYICIH